MTIRLELETLAPERDDGAVTPFGPSPIVGITFGLVTAVSALRPLASLPQRGALAGSYIFVLVVGAMVVWRRPAAPWLARMCRQLSHPLAACTIVAALCVFNAIFLDWNNSLKAVRQDSTGDDAIIEAFRSFAAGLPMYSAKLYDGAPISPGPLWVLLNGWLAPLGAHWLMTPLYLVAVLRLLVPAQRGAFLLLLLINPLVWTTSGTGHDHVALGLAFLGCLLWVRRATGAAHALGLTLAATVLATSRVVYAGFPILLALCATRLTPRARWAIGALGTLLGLAVHAIFVAQAAPYQPAHLFHRGLVHVGIPLMLLGGAGALLVLGLAWRRATTRLASPPWFAAILLVPHAAIALGMLLSVSFDLAAWEGANYFLPVLPSLAYAWLQAATLHAPSEAPRAPSAGAPGA